MAWPYLFKITLQVPQFYTRVGDSNTYLTNYDRRLLVLRFES